MKQLTMNGLRLVKDEYGLHWFYFGEGPALAAVCLEGLGGVIANKNIRQWAEQQNPITK